MSLLSKIPMSYRFIFKLEWPKTTLSFPKTSGARDESREWE